MVKDTKRKKLSRVTVKHHLAAMYLAMGHSKTNSSKYAHIHLNTLCRWEKTVEFQDLVHKYTCELASVAEDSQISEVEFLKETIQEARAAEAEKRDGIKAAEILLKVKGQLYDKLVVEGELGVTDIEELSDDDLAKKGEELAKETDAYLKGVRTGEDKQRTKAKAGNKKPS